MFRGALRGWIAPALTLLLGGFLLFACQSGDVSIQTDDGGTQGICQTTADSVDFGQVAVDGRSFVDRVFFLRNSGGGPARGAAASGDPAFALEDGGGGFVLIPGERRTIRVRFQPARRGVLRSEINFGSLCRPVVMIGRGVDPAVCVVTPAALDFGGTRLGVERSLDLVVRNAGEDTLRGAAVSTCSEFGIGAGAGAFRLGANDSIRVSVVFRPTQPGSAECLLQLGLACGDVRLTGTGRIGPVCDLRTPAGRNFGSIALGEAGELPLEIKNAGDEPAEGRLEWGVCKGFSVEGEPDFSIAPGALQSFTLRFEPQEIGQASCVLATGSSCGALSFAGAGEEPPVCRLYAPVGGDFGPVPLGTAAELPIVVVNDGGGRMRGALRLDCADFSVGDPSYDLAGGEADTFTVIYFPQIPGGNRCAVASVDDRCGGLELVGRGLRNSTCDVTAASFDFGSVLLGDEATLSFTIDNAGEVELAGAASVAGAYPEFSFAGVPEVGIAVPPHGRRTFDLRFRPESAGRKTATVVLSPSVCLDLTFVGRGDDPPLCGIEPLETIDFGEVTVGSYLDMSFAIRNDGGGVLEGTVGFLGACPGFTLVDPDPSYRLSRRERRTFSVRFSPGAPGAAYCSVEPGNASCPPLACTGMGIAPAGCLVDAAVREFGSVVLGGRAELPIRIRNLGGQPLTGELVLQSGYPEFAIDGLAAEAYEIPPYGERSFTLSFSPASQGARSASLELGSPLCGGALLFTGSGEPEPACSVETPRGVEFGRVPVGTSDTLSFRIGNTGGGWLDGAVALGDACTEFSLEGEAAYHLAPGAYQRVVVRFTPTDTVPASCSVHPGAGCDPITWSGSGEAQPACLVQPEGAVDLGSHALGTSGTAAFTITNTGGGTLTGSLSESCAEYAVDPRQYTLPAGGAQSFTITFRPFQPGTRNCTLELGSACGSLALTGVGEPAPACWVQPSGLNFEKVTVGTTRDLDFTLRNSGGGTLAGTVALIQAGDSDQFMITGNPTYALPSGASILVHTRFAPTSPGTKGVVVDLGNAACAGTFLLEGEGDPPPHCSMGATLDLGNVPFDGSSTATKSFLIENDGGGMLVLDVPAACGPFTVVGGSGLHSLPGGGRLTVSVRYMPGSFGDETCALDLGACGTIEMRGHGGVSYAHHLRPFLAYGVERGCGLDGCHAQGGMTAYWGDYATTRYYADTGNPDMSPLLRMALGLDGHAGGQIWILGDPEFQKTRSWIVEGAEDN